MTIADLSFARLLIDQAGPQVSVQDVGRPGLMRYGVPQSGPMDRASYRIVNQVLGNAPGTPAIEVSLGGLSLCCTQGDVSFAVAGGNFQVLLDNQPLGPWAIATIRTGQTLVIRKGRWGSWCYLAFAGQLQADCWLGSTSTHGPSGLGGGWLKAGATLQIDNAATRINRHGQLAIPVSARPRHRIRVVLGPQSRFFDEETIQKLLGSPFRLTDSYDRMGVRLSGPLLPPNAALDMPSEPVMRGSIQVAGDGIATVLLADHQTTGGYPKIATILSDDLDGFAQLRSQSMVTFDAVTAQFAVSARRTRELAEKRFLGGIVLR